MKLLMTADTVGGVWTYCMDLCRSLQAYQAEIHLVTMGEKMNSRQREEVSALSNVAVYETSFRLEWMQDPWSDIKSCSEKLLHLEEVIQPDLIHLNCFAYGALPFKAPVMVVAHSDVWSWFLSVKNEQPPAEWSKYFRYVKDGLHGADMVIAPSKSKLNLIQEIYSIEKGKVIYNGRNAQLFAAANKEHVVFSMGRIWDEAKNIRLLTEAAPLIKAPVKIAGDNNFDRNSFEATTNQVDYLGKLSTGEVAEQLARVAVYALPAKYEPFGLSALEAALSGCALVLGDIDTLREIWQDAATYVKTDDAEGLAQAINSLMQDRNRLQEMGEKARSYAAKYSAEAMAQNYWTAYQQLVMQTKETAKSVTV